MHAVACIEAGKAYYTNGQRDRAQQCWELSLAYYEDKEEDVEHYARVKANLGSMLLSDNDAKKHEEGSNLIEESSSIKRSIGDLDGLANNYCNLGLYYWRGKRYERAIACTRKDLHISRTVGNLRSTASTLSNLAGIYTDTLQLKKAREALNEAKRIGEDLADTKLISLVEHGLKHVDKVGRELGQAGIRFGPAAECACGSGKEYQNCCGCADFEPVDLPYEFGGVSEDVDKIIKEMTEAGVQPSRLDFILREPDQSHQTRFAWCRMEPQDGWLKMRELPDMAGLHLASARELAEEAKDLPDSVTKPLSCILLSVCAAEAFINQVAFFLHEIQTFPENHLHQVPPELSPDAITFQRSMELTQKWEILGMALCGSYWPPKSNLWTQFRNIIYLRNELVHFKVADYEQVVPSPKETHEILKRIPLKVKTRQIPHAWPMRVLTPDVAHWCITIVEQMISLLRDGYARNRRETGDPLAK